jgi:hypothetical protein
VYSVVLKAEILEQSRDNPETYCSVGKREIAIDWTPPQRIWLFPKTKPEITPLIAQNAMSGTLNCVWAAAP